MIDSDLERELDAEIECRHVEAWCLLRSIPVPVATLTQTDGSWAVRWEDGRRVRRDTDGGYHVQIAGCDVVYGLLDVAMAHLWGRE